MAGEKDTGGLSQNYPAAIWTDIPQSNVITSSHDQIGWLKSDAVGEYLALHPGVSRGVDEAVEALRRHFGSPLMLRLRLVQDRERPNDYILYLLVETRESPGEALDRLYRFQEEWLAHSEAPEDGTLVVDVDYAP